MSFTYLLGAGASVNALPIIYNFPTEIEAIIKEIEESEWKTDFSYQNYYQKKELKKRLSELLVSLKMVHGGAKEHASIDTYAKKLDLQDKYLDLNRVKAVIDLVLTYCQYKKGIDFRYDTFFATLLTKSNKGLKLPSNINVLSWNYDLQLEASLSRFTGKNNCDVKGITNVWPKSTQKDEDQRFSIYKLNGSIGYYCSDLEKQEKLSFNRKLWPYAELTIDEVRTELIERHFNLLYGEVKPSIHYSWEDVPYTNETRNGAFRVSDLTDYLVVIGYSFPTFNRSLDYAMVNRMANLTKVYVQTPVDTFQGIKERILALRKDLTIQHIANLNEFYIPFEYGL